MEPTLLLVDDDPIQVDGMAGFLRKQNYEVLTANTPEQALRFVNEMPVDVLLTDLRMPGMTGHELLVAAKQVNPEIDVIVMTAYGSIESATDAMRHGAVDYLTKPVELPRLLAMIGQLLERRQLINENRQLREQFSQRYQIEGIISHSSAMDQVLNIVARVADSRASVLIAGETGTGKELIARALHAASSRRDRAFVAVNCAALPENLLESELFGHERGAFTGADRQRRGRFEIADRGTLFLDEIGEIPPTVQVRLLRVLQEQAFERVGGESPISVDVRIVAATNRDLEQMAHEGNFREDLYYRLNVVSLQIPPLRERREDIPPLVDSFVQSFAEENRKNIAGVSREARDALMKYTYPGNVRELENIIQQAIVLARSELITSSDLPMRLRTTQTDVEASDDFSRGTFTERVAAFEQSLIRQALEQTNGVQTQAADFLGMSERHLRYKLKKYDMK